MKTKTIGEILRDERQAHHLSVDEMSAKTKIQLKYLQALESNDFDRLPAATFVKGYIKTYAQIFGFDHQPLIALLRRDFKQSAKGRLVPREFIKPVLKKRQFFQPATYLVMGLGLIFLSLIGYVGFQWYQLTKPPEVSLSAPAENELVASRVIVRGQTEPEAILTVNSFPVTLQLDGSFETELFLTREGLNTISIEARDRNGKTTLVQRTVQVKF